MGVFWTGDQMGVFWTGNQIGCVLDRGPNRVCFGQGTKYAETQYLTHFPISAKGGAPSVYMYGFSNVGYVRVLSTGVLKCRVLQKKDNSRK
jgi:hypothetical protein